MTSAFFHHPQFNRPLLAEICHWEETGIAYVRWLEQGTNGFSSARFVSMTGVAVPSSKNPPYVPQYTQPTPRS